MLITCSLDYIFENRYLYLGWRQKTNTILKSKFQTDISFEVVSIRNLAFCLNALIVPICKSFKQFLFVQTDITFEVVLIETKNLAFCLNALIVPICKSVKQFVRWKSRNPEYLPKINFYLILNLLNYLPCQVNLKWNSH